MIYSQIIKINSKLIILLLNFNKHDMSKYESLLQEKCPNKYNKLTIYFYDLGVNQCYMICLSMGSYLGLVILFRNNSQVLHNNNYIICNFR